MAPRGGTGRDVRPAPNGVSCHAAAWRGALSECRRFGRTRCRCSATPRVTERWAVLVSPSRIVMGIGITRSRSRFLLFRTNGRPIPCSEFIRGGPRTRPLHASDNPTPRARSARVPRVALADGRPGGTGPEGRGGTGPDRGSAGGRKAGVHWTIGTGPHRPCCPPRTSRAARALHVVV